MSVFVDKRLIMIPTDEQNVPISKNNKIAKPKKKKMD